LARGKAREYTHPFQKMCDARLRINFRIDTARGVLAYSSMEQGQRVMNAAAENASPRD